MQSRSAWWLLLAARPLALSCWPTHGAVAADVEAVNVYSYRQPFLIDPLLKKFTEDTGIKVNVIFAEKGLIERMAAEGRNSPSDLLLTVDIGNLMQAKEAGVGQVVHSQALEKEIPAAYRDKEGVWWGLTRRARVVYILFPNTNDRGTHVNISGAVLAKNAPHKDNALKLMEFLASDEGQQIYAEVNNEYPVKEGVPWSPLVKSWGNFKPDPISFNDIAALRKKASELIDKVGFDDGPST
jgi:ABC-type Fe3+ transport system substrate-binding protein